MEIYVVFGNLIVYSKLFVIYQLFVCQLGIIYFYGCVLVLLDDFVFFLNQFFVEGGKGVNVIVFFKEEVFVCVDELIECVVLVGVVNILKCLEDGCLLGDNIDGIGFLSDLECLGFIKLC